MTENRGFDQIEAVRKNVGPQECVHRVQLNEHVRQKHDLNEFTRKCARKMLLKLPN